MSTNGFTCLSVLSCTTSCCTNKQSDSRSRSSGSGSRQVLPGQVEVDFEVVLCQFNLKMNLLHGSNKILMYNFGGKVILFNGTVWEQLSE